MARTHRSNALVSHMRAGAILFLLLIPLPASADSIVISRAMLDWSGMSFTMTPGITISEPFNEFFSNSGSFRMDSDIRGFPGSPDAVDFAADNPVGDVSGAATNTDGLLESRSRAFVRHFDGPDGTHGHSAFTTAFALNAHSISGAGTLTLSIPYELEVEMQGPDSPDIRRRGGAAVDFFIYNVDGIDFMGHSEESVEGRLGEVVRKSGVFEFAIPIPDAADVWIDATTRSYAEVSVPEPATVGLFLFGATVITFSRRRHR